MKLNMSNVLQDAYSGATKLCGMGKCIAAYPCGHPNKEPGASIPLCSFNNVCPLASYNVQPIKDDRPWYKIPRSEREPSADELFALCFCCKNADVTTGTDKVSINPRDEQICLDCPVHIYREAQDELAAEAAMS